MGAEVSGIQFYREGTTETACSAEIGGTLQGAGPGNYAAHAGREPAADGG
jgi:hypothetical protein